MMSVSCLAGRGAKDREDCGAAQEGHHCPQIRASLVWLSLQEQGCPASPRCCLRLPALSS